MGIEIREFALDGGECPTLICVRGKQTNLVWRGTEDDCEEFYKTVAAKPFHISSQLNVVFIYTCTIKCDLVVNCLQAIKII